MERIVILPLILRINYLTKVLMPTYVYQCPKCDRIKEIFKSISESDKPEYCGHLMEYIKMKKIIAPTNFILKGNGWAKDGYSK